MRALRFGWFSVMAVLFLTARLTGRRELFALFIMMCAVFLYALVLDLWTIMSFSYIQELSQTAAVKGGQAALRAAIYNDKPYPFPFIRLKIETVTRSKPETMAFSLPPNGSASFTIPLHCPYRGVFKTGMTVLEVNDVFGLAKISFRMERLPYYRRPELKVFPRLTELPALPARQRDAKDQAGALRADYGESFSDVRRIRPGDPLKRVHRAISARHRELYVKTYDTPNEGSVLISIGAYHGGDDEDALYLADLACECAAAVAHYSLKMGNSVLLCDASSARRHIAFTSLNDFGRLLDKLAIMRFDQNAGDGAHAEVLIDAARKNPGHHSVYAVTFDDKEDGAFAALMKEGHGVKVIALSAGTETRRDADGQGLNLHRIPVKVGDDVALALAGAIL